RLGERKVRAAEAVEAGRFAEAEEAAREALELSPGDEELAALLADLPQRERAWKVRGLTEEWVSLRAQGQLRAALAKVGEVLELDEEDGGALQAREELSVEIAEAESKVSRAGSLLEEGDLSGAERLLREVASLPEEKGSAERLLAEVATRRLEAERREARLGERKVRAAEAVEAGRFAEAEEAA
ncbi:MAG: hypothetical protein QF819_11125, partial [Gemmatimonadota bacterium]|nr:hypothetical protein [Gemmatimonadota bacterium]